MWFCATSDAVCQLVFVIGSFVWRHLLRFGIKWAQTSLKA
jgi:hypothetical protein